MSVLAVAAYFVYRSTSQRQTAAVIQPTENYCDETFDDQEDLLEWLSDRKTQLGDEWPSSCQDRLDGVLYDTAIIKAVEGRFGTSFTRLCQIPERSESDYFEEAQLLFSMWGQNRNTSGEFQEIRPLLVSFFQTYDSPNENCPAARAVLERL
ncbi:MAG: hypothetical protein AAFR24_16605 [Cyanobacteria bacterium J06627_3]